REWQALAEEIVVDLAVGGGVPQRLVLHRSGVPARLVLAQQVTDFMDQDRRVLLDGVRGDPGVVVVETPARVDRHAFDLIGFDRNQIEERRREVRTLIRRAYARRLQRARIASAPAIEATDQLGEAAQHDVGSGFSRTIISSRLTSSLR